MVEFNLTPSGATTDNAANMAGTVRRLGWFHFGCAAHTIQLTVRESVEQIQPLLDHCRSIASFFHRSPQAFEMLEKYIAVFHTHITTPTIRIDVATRWNSLLDMLKDILKCPVAIKHTLEAFPAAKTSPLSETELSRVKELVTLLGKPTYNPSTFNTC
jgi:hypothetical protein